MLGLALNELFVPLLQRQYPEITDFYLQPEGCSYRHARLKYFFAACIHGAKGCVLAVERNAAFLQSPFKDTLIMKTPSYLLAAAFVALLASGVQAQPVVRDGTLADAAGRTVYTFDKDELNKSNCTGGCLAAWPAFVAKPAAVVQGDFGLIDTNGARQWTVKGKPLYYFAGDTKAGERNGDGSGGVWHVVGQASKPAVAAMSSAY